MTPGGDHPILATSVCGADEYSTLRCEYKDDVSSSVRVQRPWQWPPCVCNIDGAHRYTTRIQTQ